MTPIKTLKLSLTLRLFDRHRFSHARSSGTSIIDGYNTDVVICSLNEPRHSVGQIFTSELCTACPVLLPSQNLSSQHMLTLRGHQDFSVYSKRQQRVFNYFSTWECKKIFVCTFSTWYPKISPPPLYRGGFQATMTKSFPVSTIHGVGGPGGTTGSRHDQNEQDIQIFQTNISALLTETKISLKKIPKI